MSFFVTEIENGIRSFYDVDQAVIIRHNQVSVDRSFWAFEFRDGFLGLGRKRVIIARESRQTDYEKVTLYFANNSTGL